ncbi:MAG: hypothetical protein LC732_00745, partial [Acidobacteria bacterium]|nr:hypothetical protein [Acidobacteriota bacterium]
MRRLLPAALLLPLLLPACVSSPPPTDSFRVLVYNIHAGKDAAGEPNIERIAELIASTDAHLVL